MEVILQQNVQGIGKAGAVVKVKDGFARNYLFPKKLAVEATTANQNELKAQQQKQSAHDQQIKKEAEALKEKLAKVSLTIPMLAQEKEKIFGSVTALEISRALHDEGIEIDKTLISLDEPLKALGIFEVPVLLHPEVSATVKVWIVKK